MLNEKLLSQVNSDQAALERTNFLNKDWNKLKQKKGSFYVHWGYNRSYYRNADIHFKGKGFDFTLGDVSAHDVPEEFDAKIYLNPVKLTIPQFNFRMGYYLDDHYSVSLGWDHMKYRITEYQQVSIDGYIDEEISEEYGQVYSNQNIILTPGFVRFEHSDGNNFVRVAIERQDVLKASKNNRLRLENLIGLSLGLAVPWTDDHLFGVRYTNKIHIAGWGTSALLGLRANYGNHIYLQYRFQIGYLNLTDILIQDDLDSRAAHDIKFTEMAIALGYNFHIKRKNK